MFNARTTNKRTPVIFDICHHISGIYLLTHVIDVSGDGGEAEIFDRGFARCTHFICVKITECISHQYFALERCIKAETTIGSRDTDCCKLCCRVQHDVAFINRLGALIKLEARF